MITIGLTAKPTGAGPTDPRRKRSDSKAVRAAQSIDTRESSPRDPAPIACETATVRDGEKVFKGRDEVVERLWKVHCLTDCVKTVAPHALKVLFLLVCVTVWKTGLPDVGGLIQLLGAVKFW